MFGGMQQLSSNFPFMVYLVSYLFDTNNHKNIRTECTGVFLTQTAALTVAHCFVDSNGANVLAEEISLRWWFNEGYTMHKSDKLLVHPQFTNKLEYDIGIAFVNDTIFKVTAQINFRREIAGVCFMLSYGRTPWFNEDRPKLFSKLQKIPIRIESDEECFAHTESVTNVLCGYFLKNGGICPGDDGAVLVCNGFLQGVFISQAQKLECENSRNTMLFFSNIYTYKEFIQENTGIVLGAIPNYSFSAAIFITLTPILLQIV